MQQDERARLCCVCLLCFTSNLTVTGLSGRLMSEVGAGRAVGHRAGLPETDGSGQIQRLSVSSRKHSAQLDVSEPFRGRRLGLGCVSP